MDFTVEELTDGLAQLDPQEFNARRSGPDPTRDLLIAAMEAIADNRWAEAWPDWMAALSPQPWSAVDALVGTAVAAGTVDAERRAQLTALVVLLASPDRWVSGRALERLVWSGHGAAGVLRAVRRSRLPVRRAALRPLAEWGWHELDETDRDLLARLIRIKQRTEAPEPVSIEGAWYALPTTDQPAVLNAFDLCDPVPATMRMGFAAYSRADRPYIQPLDSYRDGDEIPDQVPVFVSPALDGWTLVLAANETLDPSHAEAHRRCAQLSRRFGTAHFYAESYESGNGDFSAWCVARNGAVLRHCRYDNSHASPRLGPQEAAPTLDTLRTWVADHDHGTGHPPAPPPPRRLRPRRRPLPTTDEWELNVANVSWRLSVSPETLGPHTRVQGTGVLTIPTAYRDKRRYGPLPV